MSDIDVSLILTCLKNSLNVRVVDVPMNLERITNEVEDARRKFVEDVREKFERTMEGEINKKGSIYWWVGMENEWGTLRIRGEDSLISIKMLGGSGSDEIRIVRSVVKRCHQIWALRRLNATRTAEEFMVPVEEGGEVEADSRAVTDGACPLKFTTVFPLNHRCKLETTILSLQSSVLHPFAVSNRANLFVYKDTNDAIFYLRLEPMEGRLREGTEEDGIELLVYGVEEVGKSITSQLVELMRTHIDSVALSALSNILRNNTQFNVAAEDVTFLKSFATESVTSFYTLPGVVVDPMLYLLYVRQNICASGFVHSLCMEPAAQHLLWFEDERGGEGDGRGEEEREEYVDAEGEESGKDGREVQVSRTRATHMCEQRRRRREHGANSDLLKATGSTCSAQTARLKLRRSN